jgi:hypothetical protein
MNKFTVAAFERWREEALADELPAPKFAGCFDRTACDVNEDDVRYCISCGSATQPCCGH